jgi:hypothetical protein
MLLCDDQVTSRIIDWIIHGEPVPRHKDLILLVQSLINAFRLVPSW